MRVREGRSKRPESSATGAPLIRTSLEVAVVTSSFGHAARVLGGVLAVSATTILVGSGVASATDPLIGQTYATASATVQKWKATPVLSTVVGDALPMEKCLVFSWRKDLKAKKIYLSVYCDGGVASATDSGYSAASPEGRAAKQHAADVQWLKDHPELCVKYKQQRPDLFKDKPLEGCEGAV